MTSPEPTVDAGASSSGSAPDGGADPVLDGSPADASADRVMQVSAGLSSSCALYAGGAMYCWGSNANGQIGVSTSTTDRVAPVRVPIEKPIISMSVGTNTVCAVDDGGALRCWGDNQFADVGVLPDASPDCGANRHCEVSPRTIPGLSVKKVAVGYHHACAISQDDHVYCWGTNSASQSAQPLSARYVAPPQLVDGLAKVQKLAFGYGGRTACALDRSGAVFCWGDNHEGAVGHAVGSAGDAQDGGAVTNAAPTKVVFPGDLANDPVIDLVGAATMCAATQSGKVLCWGRNQGDELQLGTPDPTPHPAPTLVAALTGVTALGGGSAFCALRGESTPLCWGPSGLATGSVSMDAGCKSAIDGVAGCRSPGEVSGPKLVQVSIGPSHALGLAADGTVYAWGDDNYGRTGIADLASKTDGSTFAFSPLPVNGLP